MIKEAPAVPGTLPDCLFHLVPKTFLIVCLTAGTSERYLGRRAGEVTQFQDLEGN